MKLQCNAKYWITEFHSGHLEMFWFFGFSCFASLKVIHSVWKWFNEKFYSDNSVHPQKKIRRQEIKKPIASIPTLLFQFLWDLLLAFFSDWIFQVPFEITILLFILPSFWFCGSFFTWSPLLLNYDIFQVDLYIYFEKSDKEK